MIILRQKEYATGVERAMVAMNKVPKSTTIEELARGKSEEAKKVAIKKIKQTLGEEAIGGKHGKSIGGFFRGKSIRARIKMGQVSPEAVKRLEEKKIAEALKDSSLSPKAMEEKLRETVGTKVKNKARNIGTGVKNGAASLYNDTSNTIGNGVGFAVSHPGYVVSQTALTFGPAKVLNAAQYAKYTAASSATHPGTGIWLAGKWVTDDIPFRRAVKDPVTNKRLRDSSGKIIRRNAVPLRKIVNRWGRNSKNKIVDTFDGKALKGSLRRMATTVRESHRASHPYEYRLIPVGQ